MTQTVMVKFIEVNGDEFPVAAKHGDKLMQAAVNNGIQGIVADCGGSLACATCHVHVAREWWDRVGPPDGTEAAMLEMAIDADELSRLSCQIVLTEQLDGLVVHLPAKQF